MHRLFEREPVVLEMLPTREVELASVICRQASAQARGKTMR